MHPPQKVAIAEEALRRAKAAGSLPAEGGRRAVEESIDLMRKDAKAARARRTALARRAVPSAVSAAAERASQVFYGNKTKRVLCSCSFIDVDLACRSYHERGGGGRGCYCTRTRRGIADIMRHDVPSCSLLYNSLAFGPSFSHARRT